MRREFSAERKVIVDRTCAKCGHYWSYEDKASTGRGDSFYLSDDEIYAEMEAALDDNEKRIKLESKRMIICPKCSYLAKQFINNFFLEGFAKDLKKIHQESIVSDDSTLSGTIGGFFGCLLFGCISIFEPALILYILSAGSGLLFLFGMTRIILYY